MDFNDILSEEQRLGVDTFKAFTELKAKLIKEGMPENLAEYKASEVLKPKQLEKIKLLADSYEGRRMDITMFVDTQEELELIAKYFYFNPHLKVRQIKDVKLLIELLKMLDEVKESKDVRTS